MSESQRQLIRQCMSHLAFLDKQVEEINGQIQDKIGAFGFQESYELLQSITGIKREAAATVLAEVGDTVAAFPSSSRPPVTSLPTPVDTFKLLSRVSETLSLTRPVKIRGISDETHPSLPELAVDADRPWAALERPDATPSSCDTSRIMFSKTQTACCTI